MISVKVCERGGLMLVNAGMSVSGRPEELEAMLEAIAETRKIFNVKHSSETLPDETWPNLPFDIFRGMLARESQFYPKSWR